MCRLGVGPHWVLNCLFYLCSYYPLYPPHEDMAIDYENFYAYAQLQATPDVLIVPSELRYFVKVGLDYLAGTLPGSAERGSVLLG